MTRFRSIAEPSQSRDAWVWFFGLVLLVALMIALSGCAGTAMHLTGSACGQPVDLELVDRKDRSGFEGSIKCSDGSEIRISSTDRSTSAVVNALSAAMASLTTLVAKIAGTAAGAP